MKNKRERKETRQRILDEEFLRETGSTEDEIECGFARAEYDYENTTDLDKPNLREERRMKNRCKNKFLTEDYEGTEGQDRDNYTDDQDRENYIIDEKLIIEMMKED